MDYPCISTSYALPKKHKYLKDCPSHPIVSGISKVTENKENDATPIEYYKL